MSTSSFPRILARLRRSEGGFSLIETVAALGVLFIALMALAHTAAVGFTDIALSRQRQQANQLANKLLEQARGLTYERVGLGLKTSDLTADASVVTCPDGSKHYLSCGTEGEKLVYSDSPGDDVPLVPHLRTYGSAQGYTSTFTASVYVTNAKEVPITGAFRVTAVVSWNQDHRPGIPATVTTQSLLYTPEGTTDSTTGAGTAPFFYGTGSLGRAPISITPNAGVTGGTGVTGLPSWDSMTEDLYGLEASVQQQQLTRAESKTTLTGAHKVISGVETAAGGDTAEAIADDDPATVPTTSSNPGSLMQSAVSASVSGGSNAVEVLAASGGASPPCPTPSLKWLSGMETGTTNGWPTSGEASGGGGTVSADSSVKRTGDYSLRVPGGGVNGTSMSLPTPKPSVLVLRFAIRLPSLPTSDVQKLAWIGAMSSLHPPYLDFGFESDSNRFRLTWYNSQTGGITAQVNASVPVVAGTWYTIDILYDARTSPHTASWQIDGAPQPGTTSHTPPAASTTVSSFGIGSSITINSTSFPAFEANYDDMAASYTVGDYPLPDLRVGHLLPDGMGTNNGNPGTISIMKNDSIAGETAVNSTSWSLLDNRPFSIFDADAVIQVGNGTSNFAEITFQDTTQSCIIGVRGFAYLAKAGSSAMNGRTDFLEGGLTTTAYSGDHTDYGNPPINVQSVMVGSAGGTAWSATKVNGITSRFGYSSDANPDGFWMAIMLNYAYVSLGNGAEGGAGTETGSTSATTAASAGTPCGTPVQLDGRACSYAQEDYSTTGPPHLAATVDLTGSGAGKFKIYRFQPSTAAGSVSYVWGRRTAGTGGAGTVKESVVRYPGKHEFGALPSAVGTGPSGWQGYWVKFDAGTSPASVSAEAGVGSVGPTLTSVGQISYWNGTGYSTLTPPLDGSSAAIPASAVSYTSGGFRVEISGTLASSPSFTSQIPSGASGTTTRNEARATLGSPVSGAFTYRVTNTATGAVICDLTVSVDLGSLSAMARYATS